MRHITKPDTFQISNAESCTVFEYPFNDEAINGSIIEIKGRYTETGYAMNQVCKELVYVTKGSGVLGLADGTEVEFAEGDSLLIGASEKFYWEGNFESYMVCTPHSTPHNILRWLSN